MDVASLLIQTLNGVQYGLLLFLVATGLTLIFGIMGIINLAHGSFYMIGAYMAFSLSSLTGSLAVAILLGAVLSAASNLLFAWLAGHGHDVTALIAVVSADNLAGGIASAAFVAYLSGLTNVRYSATQYALFSSMMLLLPKFIAGFSGDYVNAFGYAQFFTSTALLGAPVLLLVWLATRSRPAPLASPVATETAGPQP